MNKLVLAATLGLAAMGSQASAFSLPNFLPRAEQQAVKPSVVLVQSAGDAVRIQQLEETIRQLNGRVEEMSFQLLQMQETIRKAQEDNEFRFQDLEKGHSGGGSAPAVAAAPAAGSKKNSSDEVARIIESPTSNTAGSSGASQTAPGETTLGSIELDAKGAPTRATANPAARNSAALPGVDAGSAPAQGQTAGLANEGDSYRAAYNHVLSGDYKLAESEFTAYIAAFPKSSRAPDARFWLGEAQYSQAKYNEAAKTFLDAHQAYANSTKAPEMLLKLGMSLAALDNRDTACATLREVPRRYPNAARPVLAKVTSEQKRLGC